MRRILLPVLGLLVTAMVAAACGSDADTAAEAGPGTTIESPPATEAEPAVETAPSTTAVPATTEASAATAPPPPTAGSGDEVPLVGGEASDANPEEFQRFVAEAGDDDGPFYMVNLIRHRDRAEYPDGRETDLTGEEADAVYGQFMLQTKLPETGAEIVYIADVEQDMIGDTAFDRIAVVRYPSRAEFVAMTQDPEFQEMSIHKQAGVADTVVLATTLIETPDAPELTDPPFPATADDPAFAFVHVLDYHDTAQYAEGDADADPNRSGEDAVALYSANAGTVATPLGIRPAAWFDVQATIIGPVDTWDEVRINTFPSHATFQQLISDPTWQSGQHHRDAGLAETYALMTLPGINELNGVIAAP